MWSSMLLTAFFGALSGMLLFHLQSRVTATSTQVASLCYKLASTLLSLVLFPASLNDVGFVAFLGYSLSTASISLYMFPWLLKNHALHNLTQADRRSTLQQAAME